jgi:hypothetical protein
MLVIIVGKNPSKSDLQIRARICVVKPLCGLGIHWHVETSCVVRDQQQILKIETNHSSLVEFVDSMVANTSP